MKKKYKLAVLTSHPIQYQAPLFRKLAQHPEIELMVYFCCDYGIKEEFDPGFGKKIKWDIPLLDGYKYKFLKNYSLRPRPGFFGLVNPSIIKELFSNHYDAILVRGYSSVSNWFAFFGAWLSRTPVFLHGDSNLLKRPRLWAHFVKRLLFPLFFKGISAFLSVGASNKEYYKYFGAPDKKIFLTPYSIDNDFFQKESEKYKGRKEEIRKKFNLPLKIPIILYVGKIYKGKGAFDLLKAFEKISGSLESALVFIGEGEEKIYLENYVKEKNIKNVYFQGFKNQSELPAFYAVSDVFVFPSKIDSWGLVVNEAMACGLPVIATGFVGASHDLIKQGFNGFVYRAGDIEELKLCIEKTIVDPALRNKMSENSLKIISSWNYDSCVEGILRALEYVSKQ
ncbi:MAG: glycosyltransferase family 4 protein [bacterium]|nr:glycosyltransferase family 4 protein [bacterium]